MGRFLGGSAWAMARDVAHGHILLTERSLTQLSVAQREEFRGELERGLRQVRSEQPALDDLAAIKERNRTISRLTGALNMLRAVARKRR